MFRGKNCTSKMIPHKPILNSGSIQTAVISPRAEICTMYSQEPRDQLRADLGVKKTATGTARQTGANQP